jgi:hypothetical protein
MVVGELTSNPVLALWQNEARSRFGLPGFTPVRSRIVWCKSLRFP